MTLHSKVPIDARDLIRLADALRRGVTSDQHLTHDEVDRCVETDAPRSHSTRTLFEIDQHLSQCQTCQNVVELKTPPRVSPKAQRKEAIRAARSKFIKLQEAAIHSTEAVSAETSPNVNGQLTAAHSQPTNTRATTTDPFIAGFLKSWKTGEKAEPVHTRTTATAFITGFLKRWKTGEEAEHPATVFARPNGFRGILDLLNRAYSRAYQLALFDGTPRRTRVPSMDPFISYYHREPLLSFGLSNHCFSLLDHTSSSRSVRTKYEYLARLSYKRGADATSQFSLLLSLIKRRDPSVKTRPPIHAEAESSPNEVITAPAKLLLRINRELITQEPARGPPANLGPPYEFSWGGSVSIARSGVATGVLAVGLWAMPGGSGRWEGRSGRSGAYQPDLQCGPPIYTVDRRHFILRIALRILSKSVEFSHRTPPATSEA